MIRRVLCSLALFAFVVRGSVANAQITLPQLLGDLHRFRDDVAVASYTVDSRGRIEPATPTTPVLFAAAGERWVLASTIKILVLAAYAREVANGRVDPATALPLAAWDRYFLPFSDGGAHQAAYAELGIATDEFGFALDPARTVPLEAAVRAMMRWSDNAAVDLLMDRLGARTVRRTMRLAGVLDQDEPISPLGFFLALHNFEDGPLQGARLRQLERLPRAQFLLKVRGLADRYREPAWRARQVAWLLATPSPSYALEARAWESLAPRGTAAGYAGILARVATRTFLDADVSALMEEVMKVDLLAGTPFASAAYKGGSAPGILTVAFVGRMEEGAFDGQTRVAVVFFRRLPAETWEPYVNELLPVQLAALLASEPEVVELVRQALE